MNELINEQHGSAKREPRAAIMRANKGRRRARNEPCHLALTKFAYNTGSSERKRTRKLARKTAILMKNILDFGLGAELTLQEFAAQAEIPKEELVRGGVFFEGRTVFKCDWCSLHPVRSCGPSRKH